MGKPVALIDADVWTYSCGFASQSTLTGVFEEGEKFVDAEPVENALALTKRAIETTIMNMKAAGYPDYRLFLSGKENFRFAVAQVAPYKGNRVQEKPVHYKAIREYMIKRYGATVTNGNEADDAVTEASYELDHDRRACVIVSQDKDLRTVPGALYNPKKEVFEYITPAQALVNECRQILVGDVADNIPGCYKVGPVGAKRLITPKMPRSECVRVMEEAFEDSQNRPGCPYTDRPAVSVMIEMGNLVHLRRFEGDVWKP